MDDFAVVIDKIPKIVFSHTLKKLDPIAIGWESTKLANQGLEEEVLALKKSLPASGGSGSKDILVGSRSLIMQLLKLNLIDEFQLCVHPVVAGSGLPLFEPLNDRTAFKLINTKTFKGGAVVVYYEPTKGKWR